jgi:hypothetical protein
MQLQSTILRDKMLVQTHVEMYGATRSDLKGALKDIHRLREDRNWYLDFYNELRVSAERHRITAGSLQEELAKCRLSCSQNATSLKKQKSDYDNLL